MTKLKIANVSALQQAADLANRHLLDHQGRLADYKTREKHIRDEITSTVAGLSGPAQQQVKAALSQEQDTRIRALRASTEKSRWEKAGAIEAIKVAASEVREYLTNPIVVASTFGVGTPERNAFEATLDGLGPSTISNMALKARLENNKHLAAACIRANALLAANARQFDSKQLAQEMFGEDCDKAKVLFKAIELAADKSLHQVRETDGRVMSPATQMSMGLKHGPNTQMIPRDESDEVEPELSPHQLITKGLDNAA